MYPHARSSIAVLSWLRALPARRVLAVLLVSAFCAVAMAAPDPAAVDATGFIKPLTRGLDEDRVRAQAIALASPLLAPMVRDQLSGEALRTEVFAVYPARPSDVPNGETCPEGQCYRVDIYSFAHNLTASLIVDLAGERVVAASRLKGAQAEIPAHLTERAIGIARKHPAVIDFLGAEPDADEALMANTKTALNESSCERSRHLCVAPTFIKGNTALWVIVDLAEEAVVGVHWTEVGMVTAGAKITEESIKSEEVFEQFCKRATHIERDGWSLDMILTSSDGLQISDVAFQGRPVLRSAKLVDWHVSYSSKKGFGYSDAIGCPMFSASSVLAYGGPEIEPIRQDGEAVGFSILQDFRQLGWPMPCHYRYQQRYELYKDGSFRVAGANLGRGCGTDGEYRPVLRIDLAPGGGQTLAQWDGAAWRDWDKEAWVLQDETLPTTPEGFALRVLDAAGSGYAVAPGPGDHAYLYATRRRAEEGDADLVTLGACCNRDHRQGPEQFIEPDPEPILGEDLVFWYVAQMENEHRPGRESCWADNRVVDGVYVPKVWPCWFGPTLVPVGAGWGVDAP